MAGTPRVFVRAMRGRRDPGDAAFSDEGSVINVCSTGKVPFSSTLSPFYAGPCALPFSFRGSFGSPAAPVTAKNMENAWQFSKVYAQHTDSATGEPTAEWYSWARAGFSNPKAVRFPMGRGARPLYSFGGFNPDGTVIRLDYVEARFRIYAPLYASLVDGSEGYTRLQEIVAERGHVTLLDFDGWNHETRGLTLVQTMYHPAHKCGHGFILAMMLSGERIWEAAFGGQQAIDEAIAAEERHKMPGQTRLAWKRTRTAQPPPIRRGEAVPPVFQKWARENGFPEAEALSVSRAAFGEAKYGQPLLTQDGRDSVEDAKDEVGDFFHYLQKALMNGEDVQELFPLVDAVVALLPKRAEE
jgi:hypothetical protein